MIAEKSAEMFAKTSSLRKRKDLIYTLAINLEVSAQGDSSEQRWNSLFEQGMHTACDSLTGGSDIGESDVKLRKKVGVCSSRQRA